MSESQMHSQSIWFNILFVKVRCCGYCSCLHPFQGSFHWLYEQLSRFWSLGRLQGQVLRYLRTPHGLEPSFILRLKTKSLLILVLLFNKEFALSGANFFSHEKPSYEMGDSFFEARQADTHIFSKK